MLVSYQPLLHGKEALHSQCEVLALKGISLEQPQGFGPASLCPSQKFPPLFSLNLSEGRLQLLPTNEQRFLQKDSHAPHVQAGSFPPLASTFHPSKGAGHPPASRRTKPSRKRVFTGPAFTPAEDLDRAFSLPNSPGVLSPRFH